jgi:membrane fusion protein (multidrug efflux system)
MTARRILLLFLALVLPGVFVACEKPGGQKGGPPGGFATHVIAVKALREAITERLRVVGTVLANEAVDLKSEVDGRIVAIHFEEGQQVKDGQVLLSLDAGETEAMLAEAEASQRWAQSKWQRASELLKNRTMSQQEADEARAQFDMSAAKVVQIRERLRDLTIKAPFSGVIGARQVSPGQVVSRETIVAKLSDLDPVKVEGNVPERFLALARTGASFQLSIAAFPSETFAGEVYFVAPQIDPVSRTALVKARVANPDLRLKPGMFASAELTLQVKQNALAIPEAALMPQGENFAVIVVDEQMTATMRPVKPGIRTAGRVEIVEGLREGETVVVEGWQKTRPGGKVVFAPEEKTAPYKVTTERAGENGGKKL